MVFLKSRIEPLQFPGTAPRRLIEAISDKLHVHDRGSSDLFCVSGGNVPRDFFNPHTANLPWKRPEDCADFLYVSYRILTHFTLSRFGADAPGSL